MEFGLIVLWLAVLLLLGGLTLPLAAWLLPDLDHSAATFAIFLAIIGVVGHLVGHIAFGWPALLAGLVVLLGAIFQTVGRVALDWRRYAEASVVFVLAFLLIVLIRAFDPAAAVLPIAIGEKFLDYGLLTALERAPVLPPEDMWFAGRPVRYHYGGQMITVLLGTLTGTSARFAYNLGLATFFATLVTTAYGFAGSIARPYDVSRRAAAAFGAFFVGIAGNLDTASRVLVWLLPDAGANAVATLFGFGPGVLEWTPTEFWYFRASRVLPIDPTNPDAAMAATEFPLFAWINADLHAHMMSQPFMLLVGILVLAYWRSESASRRRLLLVGALPPVVGLVSMVNVWSLPTAWGLTLLAVWLAPGDPIRLVPASLTRRSVIDSTGDTDSLSIRTEGRRIGLAVLAATAVLLVGLLWTAPFWLIVALGGPGYQPGLWGRWSPLGGLLRIHGAFLAVFVPYFARQFAADRERQALVVGGGLVWFAGATIVGMPAIGVAVPFGVLAWWVLRHRSDSPFEVLLLLAGMGLVVLVELFTLEGERFNIIFKYYAHVWLFFSIAAGVGLARLLSGWPSDLLVIERAHWRLTGTLLAVVLIVSTGLYAGFALPAHVATPGPPVDTVGPTLDGTGYLETNYPTEAPAIRWLNERSGRPTILVAAAGWDSYWWRPAQGDGASAPASLTGLPTVIGWFHERQYRGAETYQRRVEHVNTLYTGSAERQRSLLDRYDVEYVYVGPVERAKYGTITVDDHAALSVARGWEGVTIYAVNQSRL